jgi:L-rhamnose mutarotase
MTTRRVAHVIGLRPEAIEEYDRLHADVWPAVLDRLRASNIRNYSIYRYGTMLFSYFEYRGDDFDSDMANMAADAATQRWWSITVPMQIPVPEQTPEGGWFAIPEVFHTD